MTAEAARILAAARRGGPRPGRLPPDAAPADLAAAHAVQDATAALLDDLVAGWKVALSPSGDVMRGAVLRSRLLPSPAVLPAALVPLLGIEAEIAFRFDRGLPPRDAEYRQPEVADAATALVAIEVVDSRFRSYKDAPSLDRTADCMSNGALVTGTVRPDWRTFDMEALEAVLRVNGTETVRQVAGHVAGHPLRPAVALANALRHAGGVPLGHVVTTGTFTGLVFVRPGDHVAAEFTGFGHAEVRFTEDT